MITWVLYDIEKDRARSKIARACKQAGLYRVQLSVFLGEINANQLDELRLKIEELMDPDKDKVYIFLMSKTGLRQSILLGQAFDRKLVTDQVTALFL
ncbi:MAG: CRISPR-associated endonuclease Cas2 [Saprospiraceae bacterium]|nr:CRISPR-associated endonuclease Cas2 [Lewinella sp.]